MSARARDAQGALERRERVVEMPLHSRRNAHHAMRVRLVPGIAETRELFGRHTRRHLRQARIVAAERDLRAADARGAMEIFRKLGAAGEYESLEREFG